MFASFNAFSFSAKLTFEGKISFIGEQAVKNKRARAMVVNIFMGIPIYHNINKIIH